MVVNFEVLKSAGRLCVTDGVRKYGVSSIYWFIVLILIVAIVVLIVFIYTLASINIHGVVLILIAIVCMVLIAVWLLQSIEVKDATRKSCHVSVKKQERPTRINYAEFK